MALLISLSLLWATVQLSFVLASSTAYADAASNWTWKLESCASNKKRFTLEIVAQTLENCNSTYSSETCFNTDYTQSKSWNFSLRVGNGNITLWENNTVGEECNTEYQPKITFNNQPLNFTQGNNERIYRISQSYTNVTINFKCTNNGLNLVFQNTNRSWIDALEDCRKNHSSLVEISTDTVKNKVKCLLQNYTSLQRGVWIGLERSVFGYNTEWKWISGCKVVDSQLKTNNSNRHCGMISFNVNKEIELQDANCHDNLPFICQNWNIRPFTRNMAAENSELSIDIKEESGSSS
ncbi:uncharacterized protein LOC115790491 [Archocentrus centrarchus]|uniref:uncharacterized protein LOC115790491 n=1 Tax=Archocentrus centrarchus TaxID=63155 RepID=UPI0011E9C2BA|nr:uncharacterized protein LOC115790491 [Archocentrus centrarchus]